MLDQSRLEWIEYFGEEHAKISQTFRVDIIKYLGGSKSRLGKYFNAVCDLFGHSQGDISKKAEFHGHSSASRVINTDLNRKLKDYSNEINANGYLQVFNHCRVLCDGSERTFRIGSFLAFAESFYEQDRGYCAKDLITFKDAVSEQVRQQGGRLHQAIAIRPSSATDYLIKQQSEEQIERLVEEIVQISIKKGAVSRENISQSDDLKEYKQTLAEALARVHRLELTGTHEEAQSILLAVQRSEGVEKLLELLISEKNKYEAVANFATDKMIKCNHEIAAVAYFTGQVDLSLSAVNDILEQRPNDFKARNQRGIINNLRGNLEEAKKDFKTVLKHAIESNNQYLQASAHEHLGCIYKTQGRLAVAVNHYDNALSLYHSLNDNNGIAETLNHLGHIHRTQGNIEKALNSYDTSLSFYRKESNQMGAADSLSNIGVIFQIHGEWDNAIGVYNEALQNCEEIDFPLGVAKQCSNLGILYQKRGDLKTAETFTCRALKIHEELDYREGIAMNYSTLGIMYKIRGDWDRSIEMHKAALEIDIQLSRLEGMARDYGNLGVVYSLIRDYEKAEDVQRKALELNIKLDRKEGIASQYCNLGLIFHYRKDLDEAEKYYNKALQIDIELDRKDEIALCYKNIGIVYRHRRDFENALIYLFKAVRLNHRLQRMEGLARDYEELGIIYRDNENQNNARKCWLKSIDYFTQTKMLQKVADVRELLERIA